MTRPSNDDVQQFATGTRPAKRRADAIVIIAIAVAGLLATLIFG